jgi:hypothetical protein
MSETNKGKRFEEFPQALAVYTRLFYPTLRLYAKGRGRVKQFSLIKWAWANGKPSDEESFHCYNLQKSVKGENNGIHKCKSPGGWGKNFD